ncbi:B1 protein-like [Zophobas morio]|uniref:B1 protein-like n=1 Tax=Zophobas morio TaxID=2755281 RepID=UPI003082E707
MKFAAFLLLSSFVLAQSAVINNPEDELRRSASCLQRSRVSFNAIKGIHTGQFDNDQSLKEYLLCISRVAGYINEAGYLQRDVIRVRLKGGHYSDDTIEELVQKCTENKETPEQTAFEFMKCVHVVTFQTKYA